VVVQIRKFCIQKTRLSSPAAESAASPLATTQVVRKSRYESAPSGRERKQRRDDGKLKEPKTRQGNTLQNLLSVRGERANASVRKLPQ
jgi:hypothetical protein